MNSKKLVALVVLGMGVVVCHPRSEAYAAQPVPAQAVEQVPSSPEETVPFAVGLIETVRSVTADGLNGRLSVSGNETELVFVLKVPEGERIIVARRDDAEEMYETVLYMLITDDASEILFIDEEAFLPTDPADNAMPWHYCFGYECGGGKARIICVCQNCAKCPVYVCIDTGCI